MVAGSEEGDTTGVNLVMLQSHDVWIPVHPNGRFAGIVRLTGTSRIILETGRGAVGVLRIAVTGSRRDRLEVNRCCVWNRGAGGKNKNQLINARREIRRKDNR